MWSSIQQVIQPEDLNEAAALSKETGTAIYSGGSYLVSKKERSIKTIIDVNHLLEQGVDSSEAGLLVGAGCTLQELLPFFTENCARAIRSSCPSKNIRNQRTIGGEIAEARVDSDLYVLLLVSQVELTLNGSGQPVGLNEWDGQGVITKIFIPNSEVRFERVALLDSAPAFVIVVINNSREGTHVAVGGHVSQTLSWHFSDVPKEWEVREFLSEVSEIFKDDHFGSVEYKKKLVSSLVYELTVNV